MQQGIFEDSNASIESFILNRFWRGYSHVLRSLTHFMLVTWDLLAYYWGIFVDSSPGGLTVYTGYSQSAKIWGLIREDPHRVSLQCHTPADSVCPGPGWERLTRPDIIMTLWWTSIKMKGHGGITQNCKRWLSWMNCRKYSSRKVSYNPWNLSEW